MPFPILPPSIGGAVAYTNGIVSVPTNMLRPVKELAEKKHKIVPLSFSFAETPSWFVNFGVGSPSPPISQIACMYIDCTQSEHDCIVIFPDTGCKLQVGFGDAKTLPCFTGTGIPKFYVLLDDNGNTSATDIINITCSNELIYDFEGSSFLDKLSYGYSQFFELAPTFTQSTASSFQVSSSMTSQTIFNNTQWYITSININYQTSGAAMATLSLEDNGTTFFNTQLLSSASESGTLVDLAGLNYVSSGNGPLKAVVSSVSGTFYAYVNIAGGVLVT